jgi:hypothetical protein
VPVYIACLTGKRSEVEEDQMEDDDHDTAIALAPSSRIVEPHPFDERAPVLPQVE